MFGTAALVLVPQPASAEPGALPAILEALGRDIAHHGGPFAESSSLAVMRLSRDVRRHDMVSLSGDGAEEVFAGYPRFAQVRGLEALALLARKPHRHGAGL